MFPRPSTCQNRWAVVFEWFHEIFETIKEREWEVWVIFPHSWESTTRTNAIAPGTYWETTKATKSPVPQLIHRQIWKNFLPFITTRYYVHFVEPGGISEVIEPKNVAKRQIVMASAMKKWIASSCPLVSVSRLTGIYRPHTISETNTNTFANATLAVAYKKCLRFQDLCVNAVPVLLLMYCFVF